MASFSGLLHDLVFDSATRSPEAQALVYQKQALTYADLADAVQAAAQLYLKAGVGRSDRIAIYLEKRIEAVTAIYGASAAGAVFVPVNPLLKAEQAGYILRDCNVRMLVTSKARFQALAETLAECPDLHSVFLVDGDAPAQGHFRVLDWGAAIPRERIPAHRAIDGDMAAILYTSGSTGRPKGVVLSHRNMVAGAHSVASYLENTPDDRILSVLPLSFDYGLNQLSTAFLVGACAVLMNYLLPRDILKALEREKITGLAAVPPLWIQLSQLEWPASVPTHLRYITNSGGAMPQATLKLLRAALPKTKPYLMYGLTEAFRSTYLPPDEVDRRPESMGKAIPNAEVMVVREDGSPCAPNEPGELVHRGVHVSLGYWNDAEKTAERFKPVPAHHSGLMLTELAVWSGDTVRQDEDGFFYFVSRRDEMIKTSGYRVSPSEVEEVIYATGLVAEAAALGVAHPMLGQAILVVACGKGGAKADREAILGLCKQKLPAFMVPAAIEPWDAATLPRNANGKIDRKSLGHHFAGLFEKESA